MAKNNIVFALSLIWSVITCISCKCLHHDEQLVYQWVAVEFKWPNDTMKQEYINTGKYILENNAINGIKLYKDDVYLTIPRLKDGVAASLVMIDKNDNSESPVVDAYPSWEMHILGDCNTLQLVQSMEIDPESGLMWILDTAYVPSSSIEVAKRCLPKIVVWDINQNKEVYRYVFSKEVIQDPFYLNDLVLDYGGQKEVEFVYISDTLGRKMVVYNHKNKTAYTFVHSSFERKMQYGNITINGESEMVPLSVNGIAMSDDFQYVYYCPLASLSLYRVPTSALRNKDANMDAVVESLGSKGIQSDGLYHGRGSSLYYSTLGQNGVYRWNTLKNTKEALVKNTTIEWVDSLGMDGKGYLWFTSNDLHKYFRNGTKPGKSNYFVWKVYVGEKGYLDTPKGGPVFACKETGLKSASIAEKWVTVDFEWPTCKQRENALASNSYIPANNEINGISVYKDKIYLTIPRTKNGVLSTVGILTEHSIQPYPSSAMNIVGDCNALQSVQSTEIDVNTGFIWMLDSPSGNSCKPKLVVHDLNKNTEVFRYVFSESLLGQIYFLEDVVLDYIHQTVAFAYISDSLGGKLIIFDVSSKSAWNITHLSMTHDTQYENIMVSGTQTSTKQKGIRGIALSPNFKYLYYSPLAGVKLYQIETTVIRSKSSTSTDINTSVREVGNQDFPTSGMCSTKNGLYLTDLSTGSIVKYSYSATGNLVDGSKTEVTKNCLIQWLDSPTVDANENLWFTSRNVEPFFGNSTMTEHFNFFLWKLNIGQSRDTSAGTILSGSTSVYLLQFCLIMVMYFRIV